MSKCVRESENLRVASDRSRQPELSLTTNRCAGSQLCYHTWDVLDPPSDCSLALFLVAPSLPIISTANVPPQQRGWWLREVKTGGSKVSDLPTELIDMIGDGVDDFPIGRKKQRGSKKS
jgi:hypothetical protein